METAYVILQNNKKNNLLRQVLISIYYFVAQKMPLLFRYKLILTITAY